MKQIFLCDKWKVIQKGFYDNTNKMTESVMSLGNGHLGIRGNFEEEFTGSTLKGTYVAGVYYPDKTRVGWWKNGYPEYFAKVLNACDFLSLKLVIDGQNIDINKCLINNFVRTLDMQQGTLTREFDIITRLKKRVHIYTQRFLSMHEKEIGAIKYQITPLTCDVEIEITSMLNGRVRNEDANYDEVFWDKESSICRLDISNITLSTKKTDFLVSTSKNDVVFCNSDLITGIADLSDDGLLASVKYSSAIKESEELTLYKYFSVTTNRDYKNDEVKDISIARVQKARKKGYAKLLKDHAAAWEEIWFHSDVEIEGDVKSQQGIRFNIFHMNQTYTGHDNRLNIGPKGFTGEKYGGSTYWDTEIFCLPFFLSTAKENVSKNLLIYRYNHLEKARENAAKLGLRGALFPMVTMNGEECHNEWEITFEEIHRNGAISLAIYNYVNYTGDEEYLSRYGVDVLYEIARFWTSRVSYNQFKKKYMILGVTGPNEYENNVNNNYYTNKMAAFSLSYAYDVVNKLREENNKLWPVIKERLNIQSEELELFKKIAVNMYYPYIEQYNVFAQQDGFIDKEQLTVNDLNINDRPLCQNWSWDRILRSCFIKQADVLQAMYNLQNEYNVETIKKHYDYYEPMTVHESSLSSCIYSIIASEIGYYDKAYELYLRASRLDLDDYNNDTEDGLHITSTTGSWLAIVHGFAGLKVRDNRLVLNPNLPKAWIRFSFRIYYRGTTIRTNISKNAITITQEQGNSIVLLIYDKLYTLNRNQTIRIDLK